MSDIPKNMISESGRLLVSALLLRGGVPCRQGKDGFDLLVTLERPRRNWQILVTTNLRPKKAGAGKTALDWWVPKTRKSHYIACVDLDTLRAWLFRRSEFEKLSQQQAGGRFHLYMYTDKAVALRGSKAMKFDYEFESYRLENRLDRGVFDKE